MKKIVLKNKFIEELTNRPIASEHEPKVDFRFRTEFPQEFGINSWVVDKISCPKMKKGLLFTTWEDISIEMLDPIHPSSSEALYKIQDKKNFIITLSSLDPVGEIVESWHIHVEKFKSIDFGGTLAYSDDSIKKVTAVMKIKKCVLL